MDTPQRIIQTQMPPSHDIEAESRVNSTTGQRLETQEVVPQCGQTGHTERRAPIQWHQALQILAFLLCFVVFLHSCRYLWRALSPGTVFLQNSG